MRPDWPLARRHSIIPGLCRGDRACGLAHVLALCFAVRCGRIGGAKIEWPGRPFRRVRALDFLTSEVKQRIHEHCVRFAPKGGGTKEHHCASCVLTESVLPSATSILSVLAVKTISRPTISLLFGCLLASAQVPTPADKYAGSDPEALRQLKERAGADFDIRQREQAAVYGADREAKARDWELILGRRAALDAYRAATDRTGLRVTVNSFGLPKSLSRLREPLSAPSSDDSVEVAKGFLRTHEDLFRLSEEDLAGLRLVSKDASSSGLVFLHFTQSVGGIDVYQGHAKVTLNKAGQVIQAGVGDIIPRLQLTAKPELSAQDAVQTAFRLLGLDPPSDLEQLPSRQARHTLFRNPAGDQYNPIRVELSILPLTVSSVRLAYRLFLGVGQRTPTRC